MGAFIKPVHPCTGLIARFAQQNAHLLRTTDIRVGTEKKTPPEQNSSGKKIGAESAVLHFVFFIVIVNKMQQSAKENCLLKRNTLPEVFPLTAGIAGSGKTKPFEKRRSRYKETAENKAEAYRVYVEHLFSACDAVDARIFSKGEMDEETGLYYYGARYLDPKYSRWLSGDPALSDYIPKAPIDDEAKKHNENLPGMGGVFNVVNLHLYHYAGNNPVKYTDPDGRDIIYLNDQTAVGGNGHGAMLIGNNEDGWTYYSKDGPFEANTKIDPTNDKDDRQRTENGNFKFDQYKSIKAFNEDKAVSGRYNRRIQIKTSRSEDAKMTKYADQHWNDKYNFGIENCSDLVLDTMLSSGNKLLGLTLLLGTTDEIFPLTSPNRLYDTLNSVYGESFTSRLGSEIKNQFGVLPRMLMDSVFPKR